LKNRVLPFEVFGLSEKLNALGKDGITELFEVLLKMSNKVDYNCFIRWWNKVINYLALRLDFPNQLDPLKLPSLEYNENEMKYSFGLNTQMHKILYVMKPRKVYKFTRSDVKDFVNCPVDGAA
jgi:hypothetical protein